MVRIAVLSNFTLDVLKDELIRQCAVYGIKAEIYIAPYAQYAQKLLLKDSDYHRFGADITFLFINRSGIISETIYDDDFWRSEHLRQVNEYLKQLIVLMDGKKVVHSLETSSFYPLGIVEPFDLMVDGVNTYLRANADDYFVVNTDVFWKNKVVDNKLIYLADMRVPIKYIPDLANTYMGYIIPLAGKTKKCLVLDLDNTLWGGVVGEEGLNGIKLSPLTPYYEMQKRIIELFRRGVILAVNSKNNLDEGLKAINTHPDMLLREKYFASIRINWDDKAKNMREIAKELNIGLDSLVFIDDSPQERALIRQMIPEVLVIDPPVNPEDYPDMISRLVCFNQFRITDEDFKRGQMYVDQRKRQEFMVKVTDMDSYLKGLEIEMIYLPGDDDNVERIAQLTQKTNQFNLTTKRYSEEQIRSFISNKDYLVRAIRVKDKFGDNGITGVAIIQKKKNHWYIDTLLLSCRILGKRIENAFLGELVNEIKGKKIIGEYIHTEKNEQCRNFYKEAGFKKLREGIYEHKGYMKHEPHIRTI